MSRPRKPTALLVSLDHNRKRYERQGRFNEPVPEGEIGPYLRIALTGDYHKDMEMFWNLITSTVPEGVLKSSDRISVHVACGLLVELYSGKLAALKYSQLTNLLSKLGMTPADRSKIGVTLDKKKENRFSGLSKLKPIRKPGA